MSTNCISSLFPMHHKLPHACKLEDVEKFLMKCFPHIFLEKLTFIHPLLSTLSTIFTLTKKLEMATHLLFIMHTKIPAFGTQSAAEYAFKVFSLYRSRGEISILSPLVPCQPQSFGGCVAPSRQGLWYIIIR